MNHGRTVFAQLLEFVPFSHFEHLVDVHRANKGMTTFSAWSHFVCLVYAQLTRRSGLRDLVACLNAQRSKLYHIGIRGAVSARPWPMQRSEGIIVCSRPSASA